MSSLINYNKKKVYGWSNSVYSDSYVYQPKKISEISKIFEYALKNKKVISVRSAGNSYSDNTLNSNQIIIDISLLNKIINWNKETGIIKIEGGVNFFQILSLTLLDGWIPAVMPGSGLVSIAGAIANNIHGKNSYKEGFICDNIISIKILLPNQEILSVSRRDNRELFFASIHSWGLLGIILEIELSLKKINSFYLTINKIFSSNFNELVDHFNIIKKSSDYSIAHLNTINLGNSSGKGILSHANFDNNFSDITIDKIPTKFFYLFSYDMIPFLTSFIFKNKKISSALIGMLYELKFHKINNIINFVNQKEKLSKFHFPNNYIFPNYNKIYPCGFFEYQPMIPKDNIKKYYKKFKIISKKYNLRSFMTSMKAIKYKKDVPLLDNTIDGFTITFDIPKWQKDNKYVTSFFFELNDLLIEMNGKLYFGKTPILNKKQLLKMYPNIQEFITLKAKYDPKNILQSSMYRRIMEIKDNRCETGDIYKY